MRASCRKFVAERSDFRLMKNLTVHNLCDIFTCRNRNRRVGCVAATGDSHMMRDIGLMYVEGEVKAGRLTGRTVLVIETSREIDPSRPGYSSREIQRLVTAARAEWERRYDPADVIRLDYQPAVDRASAQVKRSFQV